MKNNGREIHEVKMLNTIEEMMNKHREIKRDIITLMEKANGGNIRPQSIANELFKIYQKVK